MGYEHKCTKCGNRQDESTCCGECKNKEMKKVFTIPHIVTESGVKRQLERRRAKTSHV